MHIIGRLHVYENLEGAFRATSAYSHIGRIICMIYSHLVIWIFQGGWISDLYDRASSSCRVGAV